jgi:hypothetical protein
MEDGLKHYMPRFSPPRGNGPTPACLFFLIISGTHYRGMSRGRSPCLEIPPRQGESSRVDLALPPTVEVITVSWWKHFLSYKEEEE